MDHGGKKFNENSKQISEVHFGGVLKPQNFLMHLFLAVLSVCIYDRALL